jgi:cell division protease FtsH
MTKSELENKVAMLLGGRVAEELIFQEISTGAQDDLMKATDIAKSMVKTYGMSEKLGGVSFDGSRQPTFLPTGQTGGAVEYSEETAREIDCEIRTILDAQFARVRAILQTRQDILRKAAAALLEHETMTGDELLAFVGSTA